MEEVVTSVKRVTDIIGEIADASAEQTAGIEQVNKAIAAMDQATQQNAALVEQSAAAAASVRDQAAVLRRATDGFVLAGDKAPVKESAAAPARTGAVPKLAAVQRRRAAAAAQGRPPLRHGRPDKAARAATPTAARGEQTRHGLGRILNHARKID